MRADNDNGEPFGGKSDILLVAALQSLARHGLSAARDAHDRAESAFLTGERADYEWWLGICRTLDSRLAAKLEARLASASVP